jgi:hypothetical protein
VSTLQETAERIRGELGANVTCRGKTPAPRTITLGPDELAHTWEGRPEGSICIGIRLPSVGEKDSILKEAIDLVLKADDEMSNEDAQLVFEKHQVRLLVSRSICDPNDVTKAHPLFLAPDLMIPRCFTERAVARIFDACEMLAVESSPISPEVSDDEVELLCTSLNGETLGKLEPHREARARRFLWFVLEELKRSA